MLLNAPAAAVTTATPEKTDCVTGILAGVLAVLVVAVYWPTISRTAELLAFSDDMAHGFFAPIVAAVVVWEKRNSAFRNTVASTWGLPILALAGLIAIVATLGGSTTVARFACLMSGAGCVVLAGGFRAFRNLSFPVLLLIFTFPVPAVLYGELTLPLQLFASKLSEHAFELLGFSVFRDGNILQLAHQRLSVVEACSGIRSLITLSFFCLVYVYFMDQQQWRRAFVVAAAIPAAIFVNVVRITSTGVLGKYAPEYTHGVYHDILGWVCFGLGFLLVFLMHRLVIYLSRERAHA
jgi:exosortase